MNSDELSSVCGNIRYLKREPGDVIFKEGDYADCAFIILKGQVSVSIPDPIGKGLIEPKKEEEVVEEVCEQVEVIDKNKRLTKEEIEKLDPKE